MNHWYIENPNLLKEVKSSIRNNFPLFQVVTEKDTVYIRGILILFDVDQIEIDRYLIEIELLPEFPKSVPLVREINGRIPHTGERHIYINGDCCLFIPEETWKFYSKGTTIIDFLNKVVTAYFLNQTNYELTGKWLWGERKHGLDGIIEFYKEELLTEDIVFIYNFIQNLAKVNIKKHQDCFCDSNKKLKHCHLKLLLKYRKKIKPEIAKKSLEIFDLELEKYKKFRELERLRADENQLKRAILGV